MKYFGTDGIRGKAYDYISFDMAFAVGRSMQLFNAEKLIIARDTRESGLMIVNALKQGAKAGGVDVIDIDIIATPILAYLSKKFDCMGVMVTASHNPYLDNGIKIFNRGKKLSSQFEELIEKVIDEQQELRTPSKVGVELPEIDPLHEYQEIFDKVICKSNLSIALDFANGAAVKSAKFLFSRISSKLAFLGDMPNGKNINKNCGSTHINTLVEAVKRIKCDIGFAFDGDGDRVLGVASDGTVIDGDHLLYIFATYLQSKDLLKNNTVVLTKMSNLGIIKALKANGINVVQTDVGDKYVFKALDEYDAVIGGENSGHIINRTLLDTGDGALNAAFLVKILTENKTDVSALVNDIEIYPERLINLRNIDRNLVANKKIVKVVEKIKTELADDGKVLVRPSGTEPVIRVFVSAKTEDIVDKNIQKIIDAFNECQYRKEKDKS